MDLLKESRISQSSWKIILLASLSIFLALLFSYSLKKISPNYLYLILGSGGGFIILAILQSIFIKKSSFLLIINFLSSLAVFSGFWQHLSVIFLGAFILTFYFLIRGSLLGKKEQQLFTKFSYFRISRRVLSKILTALAVLGTFILYLYFSGQLTNEFVSPEKFFQKAVAPSAKIIDKFYPGFDFSLTGNEFLRTLALKELTQTPNLKGLPKDVQERILSQSVSEFKKQLEELTGTKISENYYEKRLDDFIYAILSTRIIELPSNYQSSAVVILLVIGFLIIRSLIVPFGWLVNFLGFLIFKLLIASGFAEMATEDVKREIIVLR